jgi:hypothetical protein
MREPFEQLCQGIIEAVNQAPTGQVLNHSDEPVRDLLADFRVRAFQTALQLKIDAAEAAFSPDRPTHPPAPGE